MKVLTEGHLYQVPFIENPEQSIEIPFINKKPIAEGSSEMELVHDGVTNEDLIAVVVNRLQFLQSKMACKENACAITHLQEAKMWLEERTRDRQKRGVEGKHVA